LPEEEGKNSHTGWEQRCRKKSGVADHNVPRIQRTPSWVRLEVLGPEMKKRVPPARGEGNMRIGQGVGTRQVGDENLKINAKLSG